MSYYFAWQPYVSVAEKRRRAEREVAKLKKRGQAIAPVRIEGRKNAKSFWGQSWCTNLERYSDFENRLPRGRSDGRRLRSLQDQDRHRARQERALESNLSRLCRIDRFAGRVTAGSLSQGRHGSGVPGGRRPVSVAGRDQAQLQLSGRGRHVQARCGGSLWSGRQA